MPAPCRSSRPHPTARGFTLIESILVLVLLAAGAGAILAIQPQLRQMQDPARDELVGQMVMNACAERLLSVRRQLGFNRVEASVCNGLGGVGGFAANPTVTFVNAAGTSLNRCSVDFNVAANRRCTATIRLTRSTGVPVDLLPVTVQLSFY